MKSFTTQALDSTIGGFVQYNDLVAELGVIDFKTSLAFYTSILGFRIEYSRLEDGFAFLSLGGSQLMIEQVSGIETATDEELAAGAWRIAPLEPPLGRGINLSIRVPSLGAMLARLAEVRHPLVMDPREAWYRRGNVLTGEYQLVVADPSGYLLRFQEFLGERPCEDEGRGKLPSACV